MKRICVLALAGLLVGCVRPVSVPLPQTPPPPPSPRAAEVPPSEPPPPAVGFRQPQIMQGPGLEGIIRQNEAGLANIFGRPRLDVVEGDARKLQFAGEACVLDVYLYPLREGGEPVATWIQARRASDGRTVDRQACIMALRRR